MEFYENNFPIISSHRSMVPNYDTNTKAICLISHYPNNVWIDFLKNFELYDIYIIVDDNSINYQEKYSHNSYKNIFFIQIYNNEHINNGYCDRDFPNEKLSGWHKALYFFSKLNNTYEHVWFFEDDVFFYSEKTINDIDKIYPYSDLLSSPLSINSNGSKDFWHWYKININLEPPYYNGMVCAVRMSNKLLTHISNYVDNNKSLFYIEALFPTLAKYNILKCDIPIEMEYIYFRHNFRMTDMTCNYIYHPLKNISLHDPLRTILSAKQHEKLKKSQKNYIITPLHI